jgi:hypothetical protein
MLLSTQFGILNVPEKKDEISRLAGNVVDSGMFEHYYRVNLHISSNKYVLLSAL